MTKEKKELKERLESEMQELQDNIALLQNMEKVYKKEANRNSKDVKQQEEFKEKLEVLSLFVYIN